MRFIVFALGIVVLTPVVVALLLSLDWKNRAAFAAEPGYITEGAREGIRIGEPLSNALSALNHRGFSPARYTLPAGTPCGGYHPREDQQVVRLYDQSYLRSGEVCVVSTNGVVDVFGWSLSITMP